jgi:N-succinyldiaminopimelate aminotransferase
MRLSPVLSGMASYPFVRLDEAKRVARERGIELIDFGQGDPREETEPFIREALANGVAPTMGYPLAPGLPELRRAVASWVEGRFGAELDPEHEIVPTLGSKEAIFHLAQVLDTSGDKNLVLVTEPGYPVPERGAHFAGAAVEALPLREDASFLPDLDAVPEETWRRAALVWVNYPNNPTGATAPLALYERLAALAREHDFVLASDEAYSELYFGEPPVSALQLADRRNVVVFNSLSKRSSMTGYRSGFVAGEPELIAALKAYRPNVGTAPQEFVQRASIAAWSDEAHVERTRERYRRKRDTLLAALERSGLRSAGGDATFFLWIAAPGGMSSEAFAAELLEDGIVVAPGSFFGPAGEGYARLALVPTEEDCARAAALLVRRFAA